MKIHLIRNVFISGVPYAAGSIAEVDDTTGKSLVQMGKADLNFPIIQEAEKPKGKGKGKGKGKAKEATPEKVESKAEKVDPAEKPQ